jgi:hypothetical protein
MMMTACQWAGRFGVILWVARCSTVCVLVAGADRICQRRPVSSRGINPHIIDATAGLGRDAFLLASLGATVTMIERSADMHALLLDGMARALDAGGVTAEIISRMTLIHGDAIQLLPSLSPGNRTC